MENRVIIDDNGLVYADIEDDCLLVINSTKVLDSDPEMEALRNYFGQLPPPADIERIETNYEYLGGKAKVRKWSL